MSAQNASFASGEEGAQVYHVMRVLIGSAPAQEIVPLPEPVQQQVLTRLIHMGLFGYVLRQAPERCAALLGPSFAQARMVHAARTLQSNGVLLQHATRVSAMLDAAGIAHLVFKGPLRQQQLYGDLYIRASNDVDLLVAKRDFRAARAVFLDAGFDYFHKGLMRFWWRRYGGQNGLIEPSTPGWSVDLHHALQPPETEQATGMDMFLSSAERITLPSGAKLPIPAPRHARLIAAMNVVKALHLRRPNWSDPTMAWRRTTVVHACDLATDLAGDAARRAEFLSDAARHGVPGTARLALQMTGALFGPAYGLPDGTPKALHGYDEDMLRRMLLYPESVPHWPAPWDLLYGLCRNTPWRLPGHFYRFGTASALRRIFPKKG